MKIIIGADLVPTKSNYTEFVNGNMENIVETNLRAILDGADYRIFNLEVPLTDEKNPIKKLGANLIAPTAAIKGIKDIGIDLFTLANNHILDQNSSGLFSTIKTLQVNRIAYVGAGKNIDEASKAYIINRENLKIGVYACAEHEFSIADENSWGANPFDPLESLDHVNELKNNCDYVIVLYHGGKEHYRYPSPYLRKVCRKLIDKGADIVITQHSHCIGCKEKYGDGTIVYGQGNFLFDNSESEYWKTSLLVELDFNENLNVTYVPICKDGNKVRLADTEERKCILDAFYERSQEIMNWNILEEKYSEFAASMKKNYINNLFGDNMIFRIINKLMGNRLHARISEKKQFALINYIECEAHRELLLKGLKK